MSREKSTTRPVANIPRGEAMAVVQVPEPTVPVPQFSFIKTMGPGESFKLPDGTMLTFHHPYDNVEKRWSPGSHFSTAEAGLADQIRQAAKACPSLYIYEV